MAIEEIDTVNDMDQTYCRFCGKHTEATKTDSYPLCDEHRLEGSV